MTRTSTDSKSNVTVIDFGQDSSNTDPVESWYKELLQASKNAVYFKDLIVRRLQHLAHRKTTNELAVDTILTYHNFNYTLWKNEVERLNALIQSRNTACLLGVEDD